MKKKFCLLLAALTLIVSVSSYSAQAAPIYGDVDSSGAIDSLDFVAVKQHLLGTKIITNTTVADLDGDGSITSLDFGLLKQFLLGLITKFPVEAPTEAKFHVFLLLGQSNMEGYPTAQASDKVEDPRILVLGYDNNPALGRVTDQWDVACPPLHSTYQGAIGPGDWFAKTIIKELPVGDTIGLVPCAINGERIETFLKAGGSKYNWIVNRAKLAQQKGGVIEGILFHQGESNNGDASWPGKVNTLVTDLKKDLGLGDIPFIAGELLYSGSCAGHNTLINKLPSVVKNSYVVSASGLVVDPADSQWKLHFGHDSQVTLGKRYAEKMIEVLGW
ncbi:MAG: sialate O-acetylesterase [Ruminiclostridium sp.]